VIRTIRAGLLLCAAFASLGCGDATDQDPVRDCPAVDGDSRAVAVVTTTGTSVEFVRIPGGCVWIGCSEQSDKKCRDDEAGRMVHVPTYLIMRHEISHALFEECVDAGGCKYRPLSLGGLVRDNYCWHDKS